MRFERSPARAIRLIEERRGRSAMRPWAQAPALENRIPRAPRPFEGRQVELARLDAILQNGPTAVITGLRGMGKTALALAHVEGTARAALRFGFVRPTAPAPALLRLAQALASCSSGGAAPAEASNDALWELILDVAERERLVIVLDDVHWIEGWEELLATTLRFASSSRWIGVSRLAPSLAELQKQLLQLGPLQREELASLAAALRPALSPEDADEHAVAAAGSPGVLCISLFRPGLGEAAPARPPWDDAAEPAQRIAETLALADRPLALAALATVVGDATRDATLELLRRGIIEIGDDVALASAARAQLDARWLRETQERRGPGIVRAMAASGNPDAVLTAIELALKLGSTKDATQVLSRHISSLIDHGYAERLFAALDGVTDPALRELRLVAAGMSLTSDALAWSSSEPQPQTEEGRLARATAIAFTGKAALGWSEALAVLEETRSPRTRQRAAFALGRIGRIRNTPDEAAALLDGLPEPPDTCDRACRSAMLAALHALAERSDLALRESQAALSLLPELPLGRRLLATTLVASAFNTLGLLRQHKEVLDGMLASYPRVSTIPWWTLASAFASVNSGDLDGAATFLERAAAIPQRLAHFGAFPDLVRLRIRTATGDGAAIASARDLCLARAEGLDGDGASWIRAYACQAAMVLGVDAAPAAAGGDVAGPGARAERAMRVIHELRMRGSGRAPDSRPGDPVDVAIITLRCQAEALLAAGDHAGAEAKVADASWLARTHGWVLLDAELQGLRADLLLLTGRSASAVADDLERLLPTPRFAEEARFLRAASSGSVPARIWAELAAQPASPIAARRAAALLDSSLPLRDAVDRAVVRAITRETASASQLAGPQGALAPAAPSLVTLRPADRVADVRGTPISLARNELLWTLLSALAPGAPRSHEELVRLAWKTEYHPLRDDARLRVAIARLRKVLKTSPEAPDIVSVAGNGYQLRA